jgi:hypothetical protein
VKQSADQGNADDTVEQAIVIPSGLCLVAHGE